MAQVRRAEKFHTARRSGNPEMMFWARMQDFRFTAKAGEILRAHPEIFMHLAIEGRKRRFREFQTLNPPNAVHQKLCVDGGRTQVGYTFSPENQVKHTFYTGTPPSLMAKLMSCQEISIEPYPYVRNAFEIVAAKGRTERTFFMRHKDDAETGRTELGEHNDLCVSNGKASPYQSVDLIELYWICYHLFSVMQFAQRAGNGLDVGSGLGYSSFILSLFSKVAGIEISQPLHAYSLRTQKKLHPYLVNEVLLMNGDALQHPDVDRYNWVYLWQQGHLRNFSGLFRKLHSGTYIIAFGLNFDDIQYIGRNKTLQACQGLPHNMSLSGFGANIFVKKI